MKSPYVSELQPNQVVTATFLVHIKDIRQKKSGEPYLSLLLGDRTGELDAKMWDNVADVLMAFERDDFVKVKGLVQIYQSRTQLTIHKMMKLHESDVDFSDFFPCSERSSEDMFAELLQIVAGVENAHLRRLLELFLEDEPLMQMYKTAPAAKNVHHAFLGGLLEHVLSLCSLCRTMASHYKILDIDLLITGAVLHDIGKVAELTYDRSFGYSTEGQLLGHIVIGMRMFGDKVARIEDFPPRLRTLVEHMIISHHGELEFGSPKIPLFPEALLLHHLDNLDSKMECMRGLIVKDRLAEGCWTAYNSSLDRAVLKKTRFLEGEEKRPQPVPVVVPKPVEAAAPVAPAPPAPAPAAAPEPPPLKPSNGGEPAAAKLVPPPPPPAPRPISPFAQKLQQAWRK